MPGVLARPISATVFNSLPFVHAPNYTIGYAALGGVPEVCPFKQDFAMCACMDIELPATRVMPRRLKPE